MSTKEEVQKELEIQFFRVNQEIQKLRAILQKRYPHQEQRDVGLGMLDSLYERWQDFQEWIKSR
jgi:hypothetical protein